MTTQAQAKPQAADYGNDEYDIVYDDDIEDHKTNIIIGNTNKYTFS